MLNRSGDVPETAGALWITRRASTVAGLKFRCNQLRDIAVPSVQKFFKNHRPGETKAVTEQSRFFGLFNANAHGQIGFAQLLAVRVVINDITIGRSAKPE